MANGTLAASRIEMLSQDGTGIVTVNPPDTNTNRTLTLPDATTTLVGTDAAQTLTNKTIQGGALTLATAVTASGTAVDFTSIPSWVKRITVMFNGVSTNGTSSVIIQIGDSGGVETTGYDSATAFTGANVTSGYSIYNENATAVARGAVELIKYSGDTWVATGTLLAVTTSRYMFTVCGTKTLSDTLTQVRITTVNGTDTFDAGTINIMYEG